MITELRLGNFKAFGATQRIPIKPLTLIFGANSAGKSSILHSLLYFHQAASQSRMDLFSKGWLSHHISFKRPNLDVHAPSLSGDMVDLGGFGLFCHGRSSKSLVELGMTFDLNNPVLREHLDLWEVGEYEEPQFQQFGPGAATRFLEQHRSIGVQLSIGLRPPRESYPWPKHMKNKEGVWGPGFTQKRTAGRVTFGYPQVQKCEIQLDGEWLVRMERSSDFAMDIVEANWEHKSATECLVKKTGGHGEGDAPARESSRDMREFQMIAPFLPEVIDLKTKMSLLMSDNDTPPQDFVWVLRAAAKMACENMSYLGGMRVLPARLFTPSDRNNPNWDSAGLAAWHKLLEEKELCATVNEWLASPEKLNTHYRLGVRKFIEARRGLSKGARKSHQAGRISIRELAITDERTGLAVGHRDVGLGMSQILPVLVGALGSENEIQLIEQPEIHLHPALQAELADVFIESALGKRKNTFIVETHSEHLILRILRRVRETTAGVANGLPPLRPEDVSVLYVQPGANGAEVIELPVTPDGDFDRPWPGGFFAERFNDLP